MHTLFYMEIRMLLSLNLQLLMFMTCTFLGMNCTLEKVLADAKSLVERLRNHDNAAEMLIEQTTSLNKRVEAMKQVEHCKMLVLPKYDLLIILS